MKIDFGDEFENKNKYWYKTIEIPQFQMGEISNPANMVICIKQFSYKPMHILKENSMNVRFLENFREETYLLQKLIKGKKTKTCEISEKLVNFYREILETKFSSSQMIKKN